jgi:hypothetical protein
MGTNSAALRAAAWRWAAARQALRRYAGWVIVVCGELIGGTLSGASAVAIAARAAAAGATVEAVGIVPDDSDGDRRLLQLSRAGVRHAAVLREPERDLEAADLELALRYLPDIRVIVVVAMPPAVVQASSDHAGWSGTELVVVQRSGRGEATDGGTPPAVPEGAIVLESPASDPDGSFAGLVGMFAARLDSGATPADAWAATTRELAVDPI